MIAARRGNVKGGVSRNRPFRDRRLERSLVAGKLTAIQARVHGRVQGVGFRYAAHRTARRLSVTGWVRNRSDGTVEVYAEGDEEAVRAFETWLAGGPPGAWVRSVDIRRPIPSGAYPRFTIDR